MGTLELSHNSHGIGHRTKVRRGPCGLFHSDLLLDIAGQLRITRALYRYLHDAQDISSVLGEALWPPRGRDAAVD